MTLPPAICRHRASRRSSALPGKLPPTRRTGLVVALMFSLSAPCHSLPEDRRQPINLAADSASFDQRSGVSTYRGNVELSQGSMRLRADQARVFISDGTFTRMEADGSPTRFRYRPSQDKPPIEGSGQRVEYNAVSGVVVVSGGARFVQGGDEFRGDRIEYDLGSDVVNARSGSQGRVQITLQPGVTDR